MTNEQISGQNPEPAASQGQVLTQVALALSPISDLLKKSWAMYVKDLKKLIGMMILPFFGFLAMGFVVAAMVVLGVFGSKLDQPFTLIFVLLAVLTGLAVFIVFIAIAIIAQAGIYILVKDSAENLSVKDAFLRAKKSAGSFFVLNLLIGLFVMLWMLLFIIPGIYMGVLYSAALWVFFCENIAGTAAIKRSKELVKGNWWAVVFRYAVPYIIFYIGLGIIGGIFKGDENKVISILLTQILSFVAAPYFIIYSYHIYLDLVRIKK